MKVAVLVCGNIRTWEKCSKEWLKSYDCFASTYTEQYNYHPYIQSLSPDCKEHEITQEMFKELLKDFKDSVIVSSKRNENIEKTFDPNMKDIYHGYYQYSCILRGLKCIEKYEQKHGIKYDIIIRTRFDISYTDYFQESKYFDFAYKGGIILNSFHHQPSDTFIMSNPKQLNEIVEYCLHQYTNPIGPTSWECPPHGMLKDAINNKNIIHIPVGIVIRY